MSSLLKKISTVLRSTTDPAVGHDEHAPVETDQIPPSDMLLSCDACPDPCAEHKAYPSYLEFDTESPLLGSMSPYGRHIMIATGQSDWAERIEEDHGTLAAAIQEILKDKPASTRTFVTNTSMMTTHSNRTAYPDAHDVVILPDNIVVANVRPGLGHAQSFLDQFIYIDLPTQPVSPATRVPNDPFVVQRCIYSSMILICSHKKRDKRCGVTAPILQVEFDHVLRENDIEDGEGGTVIWMVSHVGGHKFAGNVICYTQQGTRGVWYGRVTTCHCRDIIEKTIMKDKVIKELYRGSMSHSFGSNALCNRHAW